jgi:hypothetical protein
MLSLESFRRFNMRLRCTGLNSWASAIVMLSLAGMASILVAASTGTSTQGFPSRSDSLLKTIEGWKYPGSKIADGAEVSDGGFAGILSTKSETVLTTPDPVEKVVAYYSERFADAKKHEPGSIALQDDSKDRPVALQILVVHTTDTSTTLVISRAQGEKETHIAWSQFWHKDVAK